MCAAVLIPPHVEAYCGRKCELIIAKAVCTSATTILGRAVGGDPGATTTAAAQQSFT